MISQAMELITRAFYARSDLDLILASPVDSNKLFGVRIAAIALGGHADGACRWRRRSSMC